MGGEPGGRAGCGTGKKRLLNPACLGLMRQEAGPGRRNPPWMPHTGSGEHLENTMEAMEK